MISTLLFILGITQNAYSDWRYKYNHSFVPSIDAEQNLGLQREFSLGLSPFRQGPMISASYTYLGKQQIGLGLEQKLGESASVRAQLLQTDNDYGLGGQFFWHFETKKENLSTREYNPNPTRLHHGLILSGAKTQEDWWIGVGYHFGWSNIGFGK